MIDPEALRELRDEEIPAAVYVSVRARVRERIAARRRPVWAWWAAAAVIGAALLLLPAPYLIRKPAPPAFPRIARVAPPPILPQPVRLKKRRPPPARQPVQPLLIKMLTDDPDVVIYWIVDKKGE